MFLFHISKRWRPHAVVASQGGYGEESGCKSFSPDSASVMFLWWRRRDVGENLKPGEQRRYGLHCQPAHLPTRRAAKTGGSGGRRS